MKTYIRHYDTIHVPHVRNDEAKGTCAHNDEAIGINNVNTKLLKL